MEEYALGYLKGGEEKILGDEAKTEKTEQGEAKESPEFEVLKMMMGTGMFDTKSNSDLPWVILTLMVLFGGFHTPDRGSEYWRGKYETLKELYEHSDK